MRSSYIKTLVTIALAISAVACGGLARTGSEEAVSDPKGAYQVGKTTSSSSAALPPSSGDSRADIPAAPPKPPADPQLEAERVKLMGSWMQSCIPGRAGEPSTRRGIEFATNQFNVLVFNYQDNNCQMLGSQTRIEGSYVLSLAANGVSPIDLVYGEKVYYRFYTDKALQEAIVNKVCARSSWARGVEYGCAENAQKTVFNIVKIAEESLSLGMMDSAHDGTTAEKRPSAADELSAYQKKK